MTSNNGQLKWAHWPIAAAMVGLTIGLGFFVRQNEVVKIIAFYAPLFLLYLFVCSTQNSWRWWLGLAIFLRVLLLFSMPNLSNDVYRFIWDGRLLIHGYNPFDQLPLYYLENGIQIEGIDRALFEAFGAKNTFSSYPPIAQVQFASACWLFPNDAFLSSVVMKLWLLAFEIGSILLLIKLLKRFGLPEKRVLLYALNPLIVIEIMGNLHFEGAMIFFLLLAFWWLSANDGQPATDKLILSAAAFGLSICSKLLTLLLLPFLIKILGWKKSLAYFSLTGLVCVLLFLPFLNGAFLANFGNSLNLYFQQLEYNASIYYLLRWVGFQIWGYNRIALFGPLLGGVVVVAIFIMVLKQWNGKSNQPLVALPEYWLFAFTIYLLCTTTLHPWYLALPIVLCVFTNWRFPIAWSGVIFLTYINYSYDPYRENLWVVALEYVLVAAWMMMDWKTIRKKAL